MKLTHLNPINSNWIWRNTFAGYMEIGQTVLQHSKAAFFLVKFGTIKIKLIYKQHIHEAKNIHLTTQIAYCQCWTEDNVDWENMFRKIIILSHYFDTLLRNAWQDLTHYLHWNFDLSFFLHSYVACLIATCAWGRDRWGLWFFQQLIPLNSVDMVVVFRFLPRFPPSRLYRLCPCLAKAQENCIQRRTSELVYKVTAPAPTTISVGRLNS